MADCGNSVAPKFLSFFTTSVSLGLSIITTPGNLLICYAVIKDPFNELRTPFNYLILSLALADLLVGILMDPISVIFHLTEGLQKEVIDIQLLHMLYFILSTASILTLAALTIDRYIAVVQPIKYKSRLTARRSPIMSVMIWILSLAISAVYFKLGYIVYSLIFTNTAVIVTFLVLLFVYIRIYQRLNLQAKQLSLRKDSNVKRCQKQRKELRDARCQAKVTRALVLVLVAYIACFIPVCIIIYILNFCTSCNCTMVQWLRDLQFVIVLLNSAVNPYIYAWRMPQFKKVVRKFSVCVSRRVEVQNTTSGNSDSTKSEANAENKDSHVTVGTKINHETCV